MATAMPRGISVREPANRAPSTESGGCVACDLKEDRYDHVCSEHPGCVGKPFDLLALFPNAPDEAEHQGDCRCHQQEHHSNKSRGLNHIQDTFCAGNGDGVPDRRLKQLQLRPQRRRGGKCYESTNQTPRDPAPACRQQRPTGKEQREKDQLSKEGDQKSPWHQRR